MSDVTGPISSLPGSMHALPKDAVCDEHPGRLAVARVQGETDSFGCEMHDMCQECLDQYRADLREADTSGCCDWCGSHAPKLRPRRDYDEGYCGRVYDVCDDCIRHQNEEAARELDEWGDDY